MPRGEDCEKGGVADLKKDLAAAEGMFGRVGLSQVFLSGRSFSLSRVQSPSWRMGGSSLMGRHELYHQVLGLLGELSSQQPERSAPLPQPQKQFDGPGPKGLPQAED